MSQLIHLKQRINAIETIKKITSAMRVISMSMHSRLGNKLTFLNDYQKELNEILYVVKKSCKNHKEKKEEKDLDKKLLIIIGSDKGLCGTFNTGVIKLSKTERLSQYSVLTVGKKVSDFLKKKTAIEKAIYNLTYKNINAITNEIFDFIEKKEFTSIYCISTKPQSFFLQIPIKQKLFPLEEKAKHIQVDADEYIWEEKPENIYENLKKEYLKFSISLVLFESLFAEQAARFQSMDSATRSAENILEQTQIQYSKLRQAKITQEISELSSHF